MARQVVGIISNEHRIHETYVTQAVGEINLRAVADVCDALPLIVPALPDVAGVADLLEACHGFVFTGGRPNVHPSYYGHEETEAHGPFDRNRDALTLPLIRAAVERGVPVLGLCRGFQEVNVAFGGTLHPEIRDLPGRMNHRMPPEGTLEEKFALRHAIHLTPGGKFAQLFGSDEVMVNSLHGQGIIDPGKRIVIEGYAPDGTPEAIYVAGAPSFAMAVQWHAEWRAAEDPVSRPLFEAFADSMRALRKAA
ncbi:MAG: gamma-glutamyl-gamma-aminobutyrate hydrolase family protein [Pseudomonadota bacterium]